MPLLDLQTSFDENKFFDNYKNKAQSYLNRDTFSGTPITGEMLANAARDVFKKYGKIVPLEIALSQAQFESSMGRKGRSPKNNPYNVGEFDEGTKQTFKSTEDGVSAYYNLVAKDYLRDKNPQDLLNNFVNYRGDRYASNKDYEKKLKEQSEYITRFLGNSVAEDKPVAKLSSFSDAFKDARASGKKTFIFEGKKFTTEVK
jgi:hypothetical protein